MPMAQRGIAEVNNNVKRTQKAFYILKFKWRPI